MTNSKNGKASAGSGKAHAEALHSGLRTGRAAGKEPIAIIGIGCRFPGASGPEAFWQLLRDGVDAITEIPADRFDVNAVYDPRPGVPGKINTRWGGFLPQVDQFDPYFFGISPREAAAMDPQQRLLLEVAWEAMEDAGQVTEQLNKDRIGVFVGMCNSDYGRFVQDPADIDIYIAGGMAVSVLSGRLSYALGLQGPSMTIDTACSTSLVAVHLACQSLWTNECTLALAGGVNLILLPEPYMGFARAQMLAADGRCKFGDAHADGFIRSEGAGIVVLKPLSMALAAGDPIYAVIRGSAVNNDGNSGGLLMAPSRVGQEAVFREAYRSAGIAPGKVQYVEVHGTGTSVGDPIEVQALGAVLAEGRARNGLCRIGSVKTNIGHTEGAAGIAGLIKVALALKHRAIPPSLHFHEANPHIPWDKLPLVVQRELEPWPASGKPAIAGVSSFGISGTNAHVVLEEAPRPAPVQEDAPAARFYVLPLSAHSSEALASMARAYQAFLTSEDCAAASLRDICYTTSVRRAHHDHRLALVGSSYEELAEHLEAFLQGELRPSMSAGRRIADRRRKRVFVFSGQGSQWVGMGRELMEQEPIFRETLERCDQVMRAYVDWSLLEELTADDTRSRLDEVDVIQPVIFAVQVALATLWRSWGIEPDAVVGQSLGEVAAAHVAGALSLEDAVRVICRRSQLVKATSGQGGMAVVGLSLEEAQRALAGYEEQVSIAVSSSPASTVLSGETAALKDILEQLERRDVFCRWIKVDYASHSPQVEPLGPDLLRILDGLQPQHASVPIYSTVTNEVTDGREFDATYWVRNLREPVLFWSTMQQLVADGHDIFIEISPHPLLLNAIEQGLRHLRREGAALPSLREGEGRAVMLGSLGELYSLGHQVDWSRLYPAAGRHVRLPSYPWQRERFWLDVESTNDLQGQRLAGRSGGKGHLLGQHLKSAADSGTHFWEMPLSTRLFRYLNDHRVQGAAVLPAAAYVEIVLAAANEVFGAGPHMLEEVAFKKALFLPEGGTQQVQLVISPQMLGGAAFEFFSLQEGAAKQLASSTLHASGTIRPIHAELAPSAGEHEALDMIRARCQEVISGADYYQGMNRRGLQYGPSFQGVRQIWRREGEAIGRLHLTETVEVEASAYQIHPALLDACFQVLGASLPRDDVRVSGGDIYLPVGLGKLQLHTSPDAALWVHALFQPGTDASADVLEGDVFLLDEAGQVVLEALAFRIQRLERAAQQAKEENLSDWLYELQWEPKPRSQPDQVLDMLPPDLRGSWLLFADSRGVGQTLRGLLEARGETCVVAFPGEACAMLDSGQYRLNPAQLEDFQQLLAHVLGPDQPPYRGIIHLWGLETAPPEETTLDSIEAAQQLGCISALHIVQALAGAGWTSAPRLWLVTGGAQAAETASEAVSVGQAPLWGLGKVISVEHPELRCMKVDLSAATTPEEIQSLFQELWVEDGEDQIALRGTARYAPRVVRSSLEAREEERRLVKRGDPFRLEIRTPGILDNLGLRATRRRAPAPGEVEIKICAAGLIFRDLMVAMDLLPPVIKGALDIGWECTGRIVAVGEGVTDFQVGDEVIAVAPSCFSSYVVTPAALVMRKPARLSFEEAATIPIAFLTAYYALHHLGRLSKGERVLIHAAAGGVGQAAVQLAQRAGAEIFATAGSPEKRELLKSQGVQHVMDSRSLDFADEVMRLTEGKGVDIVLNSLSGEYIPKSLSTLGPGGRFLEIGKVDIIQNSQLGLRSFENNISFFAIDLGRMFHWRAPLWMELLGELLDWFEEGALRPLPLQVFPISQAADAFRYMAQAKHIGKIVISLEEEEVLVAPARDALAFRADRTYLITGGAGGLGLEVAQWMVEQGARYLVLMGRSGASPAAEPALQALTLAGAEVAIVKADVAQEEQVATALADIRRSMPPLCGIFHAAGVLDDGILLQLNQERFATVMAPKIKGAWNLHCLTLDAELDYFVLFSSGASVLGSPGQGNYVAANAFLDALAHYRRARDLPAVAVNWGAWAGVGMLEARSHRVTHLTQQGIIPFTPAQGVRLLELILRHNPVQIMGVSMDWATLLGAYSPPLLSHLAEEVAKRAGSAKAKRKGDGLTREKILGAEPGQRQQLVETFLIKQVARVLRSSPSKLDPHQPLTKLGIDSLMAVELKNRVEIDLEVTVPVTALLQGPTLAQLATLLLEQLDTPTIPVPAPTLAQQELAEQLLAKVDQLSDTEVDSLLRQVIDDEATENKLKEQEVMG